MSQPSDAAATDAAATDAAETDAAAPDLRILETPAGDGPGPRGWSRTRWIVVGSLAALAALLVSVIGTVGWRILNRESVSLTTPGTVAGLTLDTSDDAKQTADYLRTAVAAKINLSSTVGAVYLDPADKDRKVLFFGGTNLQLSPAHQLDQALGLLNDDTGTVTGLHDVPAGPLGGVMRCGSSDGEGGAMPVCGWADNVSLAVALFPGRTVDDSAKLLLDLRAGMEHRG